MYISLQNIKIHLLINKEENSMSKSRKQCNVKINGKFESVKAHHVGQVVYDKKTGQRIGVLIEQNPNSLMLRLKLYEDDKIITLK